MIKYDVLCPDFILVVASIPGSSNSTCQGQFDTSGNCCVKGVCCPADHINSNGLCCPAFHINSNGMCCPVKHTNSFGICCPEGFSNSNGTCIKGTYVNLNPDFSINNSKETKLLHASQPLSSWRVRSVRISVYDVFRVIF